MDLFFKINITIFAFPWENLHQLEYTFKLILKKYNIGTFKWLKHTGATKIKLLRLILASAGKCLQLKAYNDLYF